MSRLLVLKLSEQRAQGSLLRSLCSLRPLPFNHSGNWNLFSISFRIPASISSFVLAYSGPRLREIPVGIFNFSVPERFGIFRAPGIWNGRQNRKSNEHLSVVRSKHSKICTRGILFYQFTTLLYLAESDKWVQLFSLRKHPEFFVPSATFKDFQERSDGSGLTLNRRFLATLHRTEFFKSG